MAKKDTASKGRAEAARAMYAGALAQPIYWEDHYKFTGGLGQPIREPDVAAIRKRAGEKMRLRIIVILMETIKDLYQAPTPLAPPAGGGWGVCTGPKNQK